MKEALIYGVIDEYSASKFITDINNADSEDLTIRVNCDGGEVFYGWGMINRMKELTGKLRLINDGHAASMAAFAFCYIPEGEAIDTAEFMFHRAGFPDWYENSEFFTEADRASLDAMNKNLRTALEAKVDVAKFEEFGKLTIKEMFSMEDRKEIRLTAKQAKACGLIAKVISITPKKKAEIESKLAAINALRGGVRIAAENTDKPQKKAKMTIEELKAEHPALYIEVKKEGAAEATAQQKEIVDAWAHFIEADPKAVAEGLKTGKPMSTIQAIELANKAAAKKDTKVIEDESENNPLNTDKTPGAEKSKEKAALDEFVTKVKANSSYLSAK